MFLSPDNRWFIKQKKELLEVFTGFESRNKYEIYSPNRRLVGYLAEQGKGFGQTLLRWILGSHRGFTAMVFDPERKPLLTLTRPFYWFFSTMEVQAPDGRLLGRVHRRFAVLRKKYDLEDARGRVFAHIETDILSLWRFPLYDSGKRLRGEIAKKWSGGLKEIFTDTDSFVVDLAASEWGDDEIRIAFATAVSVDFDWFENNSGGGGLSFNFGE